jgi:hypothetical protein
MSLSFLMLLYHNHMISSSGLKKRDDYTVDNSPVRRYEIARNCFTIPDAEYLRLNVRNRVPVR